MAFSQKVFGCAKYLSGADFRPGSPTGEIYGLAEAYMYGDDGKGPQMKEAPNDLKMYMYGVQTT